MSELLRPLTWNDASAPPPGTAWSWSGLLAQGHLTLLTGGWKSGKTTLVAMLLHHRREGGLLLNREVRPGVTVVVSEEDNTLWRQRQYQRRLDFGPKVAFWCRPFAGRPTVARWQALLDSILELRTSRQVDLVIIDPLAMFVPANENASSSLLASLTDLQRLTQAGLATLLLHHPAKGEPKLGQAARGSGALAAYADILLELRVPTGDPTTRRRRLFGFSRFEETPRRLSIELTPDGCDYSVFVDSEDDPNFKTGMCVLTAILCRSPSPMTRPDLLSSWPTSLPTPETTTLWRWLSRATTLGLLLRTGAGARSDPFRYHLPSQ